VTPSELRLVFAVSAQGESPADAHRAGRAALAEAQTKLTTAGVAKPRQDVDFIAAFPIYAWSLEELNGKPVLTENRVGTRVQYNLHATVPDEAAALKTVEAVSGDGVELLAVDYWSDELEAKQIEAQKKALQAAKAKAELLLSVFPQPPTPINVWENTRTIFPKELYERLPDVEDDARTYYDRSVTRIAAPRPLKAYYRGLFEDVDAVESAAPGPREIEVLSTVRLYYAAPERPAPKH
ncbi:MAG: SIMPL domain-containing protein, partial [Planctomycetota bacterium]